MANEHILLIADGRSPTALRWLNGLIESGFRVTLISTYTVTQEIPAEQTLILPVAFSQVGRGKPGRPTSHTSQSQLLTQKLIKRFRPLALQLRYLSGPATLPEYGKILVRIINEVQPDLVHALRIPYEGMLAVYTPPGIPVLVSVWGNDFTLHARATKQMAQLTRQVMTRADGLIADTYRDIKLARQFGLSPAKNTLMVPGGGGIDLAAIENASHQLLFPLENAENNPIIVNPRGIRSYAQTDVFFQALPTVLQKYPAARVYCPAMHEQPEAEQWVSKLHLQNSVSLLPNLQQNEMWSLFHQADLSISLTTHDGTPNTLLEAMACGSLPIAGDIESLREWITPGRNGLLVETGNPLMLAEAIIHALENPQFRSEAAQLNRQLIQEKAEVGKVKLLAEDFYRQFLVEDPT